MLTTIEDMYRYFLDGIRKEYTKVVRPEEFNRIINEDGMMSWVASRVPAGEIDQKTIDDLAPIHIKGDILYPVTTNEFDLTTCSYKYYRLTGIDFMIHYVDNACGLSGDSEWLDAIFFRSDKRTAIRRSYYRKPKDSKLYYERTQNIVRLITGTSSYATKARIDYFTYPDEVSYDPTGANNVDSVFSPDQNQEITEFAIKRYLERVKDPRYQSWMQEFIMSQQSRT